MKFVCPKMKWEYNREDKSKCRVCHCDNPCTTSSCGRMIYVYPEKNLRAYPGASKNRCPDMPPPTTSSAISLSVNDSKILSVSSEE